ncbi:hypothetical protein BBJ28_00020579 [Nothophytophthora sp. Chile5]|nr:hypothetical protein BBJ28_00020579 [Nothophytophthora sp. Chile5]
MHVDLAGNRVYVTFCAGAASQGVIRFTPLTSRYVAVVSMFAIHDFNLHRGASFPNSQRKEQKSTQTKTKRLEMAPPTTAAPPGAASPSAKASKSALVVASAFGDTSRVLELLQEGTEVVPGVKGENIESLEVVEPTACEQAADNAHLDVLKLLLPAAKRELAERPVAEEVSAAFWRKVLNSAVRSGSENIVKLVLDTSKLQLGPSGDDVGSMTGWSYEDLPLFEAVKRDHLNIVKLLLDHGASLHERNLVGHTLLHAAAEHNAHHAFDSILVDSLKDEVDQQGNTALHYAVEFGHTDLTERLIAAGANVNAGNTRLVTPLHLAVHKGRADLAKLLLVEGKANANKKDYNGNTPLHDVILLDEASLAEEVPGEAPAKDEQSERLHVELAELLLSHGADPNLENDTTGFFPLHQALRDGYERTARVLLAHGANARETSKFGVTPLHVAAAFEVSPDLWKELLKHGADPSATNDDGKTPLELAPNGVIRAQIALLITAYQEA